MRLDVQVTAAELTQSEFAELIGVKPPYVTRLKQKNRLVLSADGKRVQVRESIAKIRAARDPARGGDRTARPALAPLVSAVGQVLVPTAADAYGPYPAQGGPSAALVYQDEAAREKRAAAQLRELDLAERAGELLLAADVEHHTFGLARSGREALMSIPDRIATILAAESDPVVVHAKLSSECRKVCELLSAPTAAAAVQALAA